MASRGQRSSLAGPLGEGAQNLLPSMHFIPYLMISAICAKLQQMKLFLSGRTEWN